MQAHLVFPLFLGRRIHLGVTGSIAAYKALELLRLLQESQAAVSVTLTASAREFVTPLSFRSLGAEPVHGDMFPAERDLYGHLAPGRKAEALVVAPATANLLAKMAHGLADDMLSCQLLSFPGPVVLAPAMNFRMWTAAATQANVAALRERGHVFVDPESGHLACGDEGAGRLARLEAIALAALKRLAPQDLAGQTVLLTLGPTREFWDPARFWSNPSTGTMGAALAVAAWLRGARVLVVRGPVSPWLPEEIEVHDVVSALEMRDACQDLWPGADVGCFTAAVADLRPEPHGPDKWKKTAANDLRLRFLRNPDIIANCAEARRPGQRIIGFAAETGDLPRLAQDKLHRKGMDMIVGNLVGRPDSGFAATTNRVVVCDRAGRMEEWPVLPKTEVAWRVWDWLCRLLP